MSLWQIVVLALVGVVVSLVVLGVIAFIGLIIEGAFGRR